jgi:NAD(P)H-hydrate repair Nnr-like enzyme with NAD(P)H-hydrate epimerase domain
MMRCEECGHNLIYTVGNLRKIRTKMILLKGPGNNGGDDILACVCPKCKSDVIIGFAKVDKRKNADQLTG